MKFNFIVSNTSKVEPHGDFALAVTVKITNPSSIWEIEGVNVGFKAVGSLNPLVLLLTVHNTLS